MLNPAAYPTAQRFTRDLAHSALPHAPVVPEASSPDRRWLRRGAAITLQRVASLLERA
jgi:hypothetical protein